MKTRGFRVRILTLVIYGGVAACLLGGVLLSFRKAAPAAQSSMHLLPPPLPSQPPGGGKLVGNRTAAAPAGESPTAPVATPAPTASAEALQRAGFWFPSLPPEARGGSSRSYFDLGWRRELVRTRPRSAEAAAFAENSATRLNFSSFRLTVRPCEPSVRIFVAIMTTPGATRRRDAARLTWLTEAATAGARFAFFIAGGNETEAELPLLEAESARHGDLVLVADFVDTYRHLTLKVMAALDFACRMCPRAEMFAKVDDDSLLNLASLRKRLDRYSRAFPGMQYVMGYRYQMSIVQRSGRWGVSAAEYPLKLFPSYLYGGVYTLRTDTCRMFAAAHLYPIPSVEDAFVTGILAAALQLRQRGDNAAFGCQYFRHSGKFDASEFKRGLVMSSTDITPEYLLGFWRKYLALGTEASTQSKG